MEKKPDFEDLAKTLYCKYSKKVHQMELIVDSDVKEAFLGRPVNSINEEIEFWYNAGYEYLPIVISLFGFVDGNDKDRIMLESEFNYSQYKKGTQKKYWAKESKGQITNLDEFNNYPWPDPEKVDLSMYYKIKEKLPTGMGVIGVIPRLFVAVWMLMGFECFSLALFDDLKLLEKIFLRVGEIQSKIFQRLAEEINVDAMWLGDDIAYREGLMIDPSTLRSLLFPWYKEMGKKCKSKNIPFVYHSDGDLSIVIDDLINSGINALHPIEPNAMDAFSLQEKYGKALCLIGNIELDILSRGDIGQVSKLTFSRLEKLWNNGGYCPGSSNSVTNYVSLENYLAMLSSIESFRVYKNLT